MFGITSTKVKTWILKPLVIAVVFMISSICHGQISYGKFVVFPNDKLVGFAWKPQMNFTNCMGKEVIGLRSVANDTYYSFDSNSRILLKFADSTVVKLNRYYGLDIQENYTCEWVGNSLVDYYITYSFYEIDENTINRIINKEQIIKVRLVYSNGTIRDHVIDKKYADKFINGLISSRNSANRDYQIRKNNATNDDGF